jgi:protein TonB
MNPFRNNVDTLNEILFENRNQNYGAYAIRKSYNHTVLKSLAITASVFLLGFFGLSLLVDTTPRLPDVTGVNNPPDITTVFDGTKAKEKPAEQKKVIPSRAAARPVTQNVISTLIKDSLEKIVNTPVNQNIQTTGTNTTAITDTPPGTGTLTTDAPPTNTLTTGANTGGIEKAPDVMPSMPGLGKFLSDNLVYPTEARENKISGKVAVNFIVDEGGRIIETKIINSVGFGCDEEAMRVIKLMPKWKPGLVNGKPVKVSFVQVISFRMQ